MNPIPEQSNQNAQAVRKSQTREKKADKFQGNPYAPECASAAAAEVGRALGIAADIQTGAALLSGGNQFLLSLMGQPRGEVYGQIQLPDFVDGSPVNSFEPDGFGEGAVLPAQTAQLVGATELSAIT